MYKRYQNESLYDRYYGRNAYDYASNYNGRISSNRIPLVDPETLEIKGYVDANRFKEVKEEVNDNAPVFLKPNPINKSLTIINID